MNVGTAELIVDVELNLPTAILNGGKAGFTHYSLEYHATSYFDMNFLGGQFFFSQTVVMSMQISR